MYVCMCMYVRTNVLVLTLLGTKKNNPNAKLGNNHQTGVSAQGSKQGQVGRYWNGLAGWLASFVAKT